MSRFSRSDLTDVDVQLHAESDLAIRVSTDGDDTKAVWLPKSQIEFEKRRNGQVVVTLPEWLAAERGLI